MILPSTYTVALLLTIVSMICWGSWANTQKLAGKWRFELFYFDYSIGVLVLSVLAALTLGTLNPNELSVLDNLSIAGYRRMAYGLAAGVVFNLANMLLVAAISIAGMAVAFPVGIGLAMVIGVVWNYALNQQGNPFLLFTGAGIIVLAIVVDAMAYRAHAQATTSPSTRPAPPVKGRPAARENRPGAARGIVISLLSGILMGSFYPLIQMSRETEVGLGAYTIVLLFAIGVAFSTLPFNAFFMNFPVQGEPVEILEYFRGSRSQHLLGIAGGMIWAVGLTCNVLAASTPREVNVGPAVSYAIGQGATMVSALWGLLVWKEFAGADSRVRILLGTMLTLFVIGLTLISLAPLYRS